MKRVIVKYIGVSIASLATGFLLVTAVFAFVIFKATPAEVTSAQINHQLLHNDVLSDIGDHQRTVSGNGAVVLPSKDKICKYGDLAVKYFYGDADCDEDITGGVELEKDKTYVFRSEGKDYTVQYKGCDQTSEEKEDYTFYTDAGCYVAIHTSQSATKQSATQTVTLGAGMEIDVKPHPRQEDVKTIHPVLSQKPLVALIDYSEYSSLSGFSELWVSSKCSGKTYCSLLQGDEIGRNGKVSEAMVINTRLGVATPRGEAVFRYTPQELYEKRTKSVDLKGAKVTFTIKRIYYEECALIYCDDGDGQQPGLGKLYNRIDIEITYSEV